MTDKPTGRPRAPDAAPPIREKLAAAEKERDQLERQHPKLALDALRFANGNVEKLEKCEARLAELNVLVPRLRAALREAERLDDAAEKERAAAQMRHRVAAIDRAVDALAVAWVELPAAAERLVDAWRATVSAFKAAQSAVNQAGLAWPNSQWDDLRSRTLEILAASDLARDPERRHPRLPGISGLPLSVSAVEPMRRMAPRLAAFVKAEARAASLRPPPQPKAPQKATAYMPIPLKVEVDAQGRQHVVPVEPQAPVSQDAVVDDDDAVVDTTGLTDQQIAAIAGMDGAAKAKMVPLYRDLNDHNRRKQENAK